MRQFLRLIAVLILPLWLLDACINRDPSYYLDSKSELGSPWVNGPLYFEYRDRTSIESYSQGYLLDNVSEFLMNDEVFTGMTGDQFFMIRRVDGEKLLFDTRAERDAILEKDYATRTSELHAKPWYAGMRANIFYPFNIIYYLGITLLVALHCFTQNLGRSGVNLREMPERSMKAEAKPTSIMSSITLDSIASMERGTVFLHARWSGQSALALRHLLSAWAVAGLPEAELHILDWDEHSFLGKLPELYGKVHGYGEAFHVRHGAIFHFHVLGRNRKTVKREIRVFLRLIGNAELE